MWRSGSLFCRMLFYTIGNKTYGTMDYGSNKNMYCKKNRSGMRLESILKSILLIILNFTK